MSTKSLATAFVEQLKAWNVKYIFGVIGDDVLSFLEAIGENQGIEFIGTANEAGAAFMASYYAKLTGELGVCVASAPGSINLLEGIADAFLDGAPVLALTGQVQTPKIGTKTKQYYHQQSLYTNFSSFTESVIDSQIGIRLLIKAMSTALLKKTVCHLVVSVDLWNRTIEAEPATLPLLVKGLKQGKQVVGDLDRVAGYMQQARKPIVIVSNQARKHVEGVKRLIECWGAAVINTQEAKGVIAEDYPYLIGGIGQAWLPSLLNSSDCVLLIGSASYEDKFLPKCPIIQIEEKAYQIDERYLWDSLAGDLDYIAHILVERLEGLEIDLGWQEQIKKERDNRHRIIEVELSTNKKSIQPGFLMATLGEVLSHDAVIGVDEGSFMHWFDSYFKAKEQEVLISSYWRSMGLAIPAAMAAQLTNINRQVVALVGDGCMLMNLGEFTTAIKYKLPIKIIVIRDNIYSLERDKSLKNNLSPAGLEVSSLEFSRYAMACGAAGFKIEDPKQLKQKLIEALALEKPAIVEVICESLQLPHI